MSQNTLQKTILMVKSWWFVMFVMETIRISVVVSIAFSLGYLHRTVKYLKKHGASMLHVPKSKVPKVL